MMKKFTEKELAVLKKVQSGSTRPRKQLARELGISEPTISRIIIGLVRDGYISKNEVSVLSPSALGFRSLGFVRVRCINRLIVADVERQLKSWPNIQEIHITMYDKYDLLLKVRARDGIELDQVRMEITSLRDVAEAMVMPVMDTTKETLELPL